MRLLHTASSKLEVGNEPASSEITSVVRLQLVLSPESMAKVLLCQTLPKVGSFPGLPIMQFLITYRMPNPLTVNDQKLDSWKVCEQGYARDAVCCIHSQFQRTIIFCPETLLGFS